MIVSSARSGVSSGLRRNVAAVVHNLVQLPFAQPAVAGTSDRLVALSLSMAAGGQRQHPRITVVRNAHVKVRNEWESDPTSVRAEGLHRAGGARRSSTVATKAARCVARRAIDATLILHPRVAKATRPRWRMYGMCAVAHTQRDEPRSPCVVFCTDAGLLGSRRCCLPTLTFTFQLTKESHEHA